MEQPSSNLFEGYRSVGHVTGPRPFIVRHGKRPQDTRIISIVGRCLHTYSTNLTLVEISIPHESDVNSVISDTKHIYSASGRTIFVWAQSSRNLIRILDNGHQADVRHIVKFGHDRLVSVDDDNVLFNWGITDKEILNIISLDEGSFKITALCHPHNYKDKILLGSKQGQLQLLNIASEQCLYKFNGWESEVSSLVQSPVEDVVGIGLVNGHVYIHNIRYDEVVMKIYQEYGPITSMSFRLDGQPYLVTASEVGHLMVWNLERKRLSAQIRNAHRDRISKCQFVRNESQLVTSGTDNTLKVWSMDLSDGGGNLLCQRAGHSEPPNQIKFYGSKGFNLLSAGKDSTMKMFHIYSERMNRNLGTARMNPSKRLKDAIVKLPAITCFAAETAREKQWDNIAACHEGSSVVTTWNYDKCRMGEHIIQQPTFDKRDVIATIVCITSCGNFLVIGFSNGLMFKYNIQSGIYRKSYECPELTDNRAHVGQISGLCVDAVDIILISGGVDKKLKLWNFKTAELISETEMPSSITKIELHHEGNLIALAMINNSIEIMDLETRTLIRKFESKSPLLDMIFSPDLRWLIASYKDCSIRTWDLSLGKMIDAFRLTSACISLSISSTGEFLATAHEDSLGINIWCNYTLYCPATLRAIDPDSEPPLLDMPYVRCDERVQDGDGQEDDDADEALEKPKEGERDLVADYVSPEQLHSNLISLSGLPASRWRNLLTIDELRQKQLIQEEERRAADRPIKVPFFIPIKEGLKPTLDKDKVVDMQVDPTEVPDSASMKIRNLSMLSPLAKQLIECNKSRDYGAFLCALKELGPSATDAEIRSLGPETCGDNQPLLYFLEAIEDGLRQRKDYELVSSWLALALKAHSDTLQHDTELNDLCRRLLPLARDEWSRLDEQFNQIVCVLNFVRSAIL